MNSKRTETGERKSDHIKVCMKEEVQSKTITTGFEDICLIHKALPEIDLKDVSTTTEILGHKLSAPIIIAGMTGGTQKAVKINAALAEAAEKLGLGMGVGSQRATLEDRQQSYSYKVARLKAPNIFLIANIGCPQLVTKDGFREAKLAIDMIKADALAIHLNPLQEAVQAGGQTSFRKVLNKIKVIADRLEVPIIAKETGAGIAAQEAKMLERAGVKAIDVGGAGGTSWAAVEYYRAKELKNELNQRLGLTFWDWGIPTVSSLVEAQNSTHIPIIATGGIRTGIDIAKALALGADAIGIALPLLKPALEGPKATITALRTLTAELKVAMFLTGAKKVENLKKIPVVITGKTADWLKARGINFKNYGQRVFS
ncbi:MAG: type 2 isopentenyl-diphosphate Delta-isomerase [Candidatus Bathyarchaeota archaeon]